MMMKKSVEEFRLIAIIFAMTYGTTFVCFLLYALLKKINENK